MVYGTFMLTSSHTDLNFNCELRSFEVKPNDNINDINTTMFYLDG